MPDFTLPDVEPDVEGFAHLPASDRMLVGALVDQLSVYGQLVAAQGGEVPTTQLADAAVDALFAQLWRIHDEALNGYLAAARLLDRPSR